MGKLNQRLKVGYSPDYFVQLQGKPVAELGAEYKSQAKLGNLDNICSTFEIEASGDFALQL